MSDLPHIGIYVYAPPQLSHSWYEHAKAYLHTSLGSMGFPSSAVTISPGNLKTLMEASCRVTGTIDPEFALRVAQEVCQTCVNMGRFAPMVSRVLDPSREVIGIWEIKDVPVVAAAA